MTCPLRLQSPTRDDGSRASASGVVNRESSQGIRIVDDTSITGLEMRAIVISRRV